MSLKREQKTQQAYQKYLKSVGGVNKHAMSYYQWKESKGKLSKPKPTKKNTSAISKIKESQDATYKSLEEALSEKELKRYGYKKG